MRRAKAGSALVTPQFPVTDRPLQLGRRHTCVSRLKKKLTRNPLGRQKLAMELGTVQSSWSPIGAIMEVSTAASEGVESLLFGCEGWFLISNLAGFVRVAVKVQVKKRCRPKEVVEREILRNRCGRAIGIISQCYTTRHDSSVKCATGASGLPEQPMASSRVWIHRPSADALRPSVAPAPRG